MVAAPLEQLTPLPVTDPRPRGLIAGMIARLRPRLEQRPVEGLLHHLRWSTPLSWHRLEDGSQQPAPPPSELLHEASSYEYSYEIVARVVVRGAKSQKDLKIRREHQVTWDGKLW